MALARALTSWLTPLTKTHTRRRPARRGRLELESLESRVVPSTLPPPDPIDPTRGETTLLRVVQMMADKQNLNAQDHFPVPYTIIASAGGAAPTIVNWKAGAPLQLDADQSKATGQGGGGKDIQVEVNTDRYTNAQGQPDWKLRLNVNRLGTSNYAQNLSVMIAFPWDAFNTETLPAQPNLMMGFQTRLPGTPGQADYITGVDGGSAPLTMQMVLTPHILAGTTHEFEWSVDTTGATNPLTFLSGEFDGDPGSNTISNALGWSAYVQDVPAHIGVELKVAENAIGSPAVDSKMDLHWTASSPSLTTFDYLEAESKGAASAPRTADYATQIVADKMPTDERFVLRQDEAGGVMTLNHDANAPIHEMTFLKRRSDGLALTGVAADDNPANDAVPTHVALTLGLRGYENLEVNANTLDLFVQDTQVGGFNNTGQFFQQYGLEYVALRVKNAPDQTASFDGAATSFTASATNPGESMPFTELVIDDDGRIGPTNAPLNLELPAEHGSSPPWHLWSITDDGTHGTAVGRALDASSATFGYDSPDIKHTIDIRTVARHPMQTYLRTGQLSAIQPPADATPDPNIEVTGEIEDVLAGYTNLSLDFPFTVEINESPGKIDKICMFGHIGSDYFGLVLGGSPVHSKFDFRPEGSVSVRAYDAANQPDAYTVIAALASGPNGLNTKYFPLPDSGKVFFPNTPLKEAGLRMDFVPTFRATWDDQATSTKIDMDTDLSSGPYAYVGGVQLEIKTTRSITGPIDCDAVLAAYPAATPQSPHYGLLKDVAGAQAMKLGVFGVDNFHFATDDTTLPSKYSVDFVLDPSRPFTPAHIEVDTHPTSTGALGTFFGGDEVTGPLDVGAVPHDLHLNSDLDPSFSSRTLYPFGLQSTVTQDFKVGSTRIYVHIQQAPQVVIVGWNVFLTLNLSVTATTLGGAPSQAGLVEVLFQDPTGLFGGSDFYGDAANPLRELRVRADNMPSLLATVSVFGGTGVNVKTVNAAPFDTIAGLRMSTSSVMGSTTLPTFPPLTGSEHHYLSLFDNGPTKSIDFGLFGVREFGYSNVKPTGKAPLHTFRLRTNAPRQFDVGLDTIHNNKITSDGMKGTVTIQNAPARWDLTTDFDKRLDHVADIAISSIDADILRDDSGDGFGPPFRGHHTVVRVRGVPSEFHLDNGLTDTTDAKAPLQKEHKHIRANGRVTSVFYEDTKDLPSSTGRPSWTLLQVEGIPGSIDYDVVKEFDVDDKQNLKLKKTSTTAFVKDPAGQPAQIDFLRLVSSTVESKADTLARNLARFTGISGGLVHRSDFANTVDDRYWPGGVQTRLDDIYGSSFHLDTAPGLADHFLRRSFGELGIPGVEVKLAGDKTAVTTTDASGAYVFGGLGEGKYQITETQPGGATDGTTNVGSLGGTAVPNSVSNIVIGKNPDNSIQAGVGYNFGERSLPNPGLPAGPVQPGGPGTLSGHVYWDENGDGVFNVSDLVDYTDLQLRGFQSAVAIEDKVAKTNFIELHIPSTDQHPFFVGMEEERNKVTLVRLDNLPSSVKVDYKDGDHLHFESASSAGRVDVYKGPLPAAGDGDEAVRVVLLNAPKTVDLVYDKISEGKATFKADSPFELRLLTQDGGQRIVAAAHLEQLQLGYGLQLFKFDVAKEAGLDLPDPLPDVTAPVAWNIVKYSAGIDNDADDQDIRGNPDKDPVNGFFALYERRNDIQDLNVPTPAHGTQEYVPQVTAMLKDFQEFSAGVALVLDPLALADDEVAWVFPIGLTVGVTFKGDLDFDVWSNTETSATFTIPIVDYEIGYINRPDYVENSPFHILPINSPFLAALVDGVHIVRDAVITFEGFHRFGDHFDPFPPMLAAGPAPAVSADPPLADGALAPLWAEAARRWAEAGATPDQLALALGTTPTVMDLPGLYLGMTVSGHVYIDPNAAGYGWYVDPTPRADEEFGPAGNGAAAGRMDLLTVLSHEMGRLIGYDVDDAGRYPVMTLTLTSGTRLADGAPEAGDSPTADGIAAPVSAPAAQEAVPGAAPDAAQAPPGDEGLATGPVFASLLGLAPALGVTVAGPADATQARVVARFDPEQYEAAMLAGDLLPSDVAVVSGPGGVLAPYTQRPSDPWDGDDITSLWVG